MSTLRVSNIEAKADVSSPSVHEKIKVTNSEGDVLVHIDGATSGISTVGINTTVKTFDVDSNQNIDFVGNLTAPNITVTGTLSYDDVTNIDSVGIVTAQAGIHVTDGSVGIGTDNPEYKTTIAADGPNAKLNIKRKTAAASNGNAFGSLFYTNSDGTDVASIRAHRESANDDAYLGFATRNTGGSIAERFRVGSGGDLFVAGTGGMNTTQLPNGSTINVNGTSSNDGLSVIRYSTGYGAYGLNIGRSKSNTLGTNAAVTNGNDLGHISFYGADGTDFNMASQITSQVDGTPSDGTDMPGRLVFKTSSDGSATPTERLRIDSSGRLAQGGKTPTNHGSPNLLLWGSDPTMMIASTGSTNNSSFTGIKFTVAGGSTGDYSKAGIFVQRQDSYNDLDMIFAFRSSNDATGVSVSDEKIRINSDGRLLINTTSNPSIGGQTPYLRISGGYANLDGLRVRGLDTGNTIWKDGGDMSITVASAHSIYLKTQSATRFKINSNGYVTTPSQISFLQRDMNGADFNGGVLKGGNSDHNIGGHYNTSTGIFTAPVAGVYMFGCGVLVNSGSGRLEGNISKNNSYTIVNFNGTGTTYDGASATCVVSLAVNDNIRVKRQSGTAYGQSHGNHYFWGRLMG